MPDEKLLAGIPNEQAPEPEPQPQDNSSFYSAASPAMPQNQDVSRTYISRPPPAEKVEISAEPMVKAAPLPAAAPPPKQQEPPKEKIKVSKPKALMLRQEGGGLEPEQERKLAVVVAKVSEMINSGQSANQIKAISVLLDIVKDGTRTNTFLVEFMKCRFLGVPIPSYACPDTRFYSGLIFL